jgi:hypothetical protein
LSSCTSILSSSSSSSCNIYLEIYTSGFMHISRVYFIYR